MGDHEIARLNAEIVKAKKNANYQDDDIERKIQVIHEEKVSIDKLRSQQKETNIQLEKVKLRNENYEGDCSRYNQQIKELEAKIRNVNLETEKAENEIKQDQAKIDDLLPQ